MANKVSLIALRGGNAGKLEDLIDDLIVGDPSRFIATTAHTDEPREAAAFLAQHWNDLPSPTEIERL